MINLSNFLGLSEGMKLCSTAVKYVLCFSGINVHNDDRIHPSASFTGVADADLLWSLSALSLVTDQVFTAPLPAWVRKYIRAEHCLQPGYAGLPAPCSRRQNIKNEP